MWLNQFSKPVQESPNKKRFSKKFLFFALAFLSIISIIYIYGSVQKKSSTPNQKASPSPNPNSFSTPEATSLEPGPNENFLLNRIVGLKTPVTGFSWNNGKILYSTKTAVWETSTQTALAQNSLQKVVWSNGSALLYKNEKGWTFFDSSSLANQTLVVPNDIVALSPSGKTIVYFDGNSLREMGSSDFLITASLPIASVFDLKWSSSENMIAAVHNVGGVTQVNLLSPNLQLKEVISFAPNSWLLAISPQGTALALQKTNVITLHVQGQTDKTFAFNSASQLRAVFIDEQKIIITETTKDQLQRKMDRFWLATLNGDKTLLANSMAVPGKISLDTPFTFNNDKSILFFTENNGTIWMLSLTPNTIPTYNNTDTSRITLPGNPQDKGF